MDWFLKKIQVRFESKHRGRLGPNNEDQKEMRILNRIVTWTEEGIEYEGDQRHVEICMNSLGLDGSSKSVSTPIEKDRLANGEEHWLDKSESTRYS